MSKFKVIADCFHREVYAHPIFLEECSNELLIWFGDGKSLPQSYLDCAVSASKLFNVVAGVRIHRGRICISLLDLGYYD